MGRLRRCARLHRHRVSYTQSRELFGRPLEPHAADPNAARGRLFATHRGATDWRGDSRSSKKPGCEPQRAISLAKWNNVRAALDIARDCRDMLGAAGMTLDHSPDAPHVESRDRDHL